MGFFRGRSGDHPRKSGLTSVVAKDPSFSVTVGAVIPLLKNQESGIHLKNSLKAFLYLLNRPPIRSLPTLRNTLNNQTMASLIDGISNLFSSLFEILSGILNGIFSTLQSVFGLAQDVITSIFDLMSGLVGFVLGKRYFPTYLPTYLLT